MRLEDHVDLAVSALAGRGQRRPNLGGMVAVVVDDADAAGFAAQLKAAVHAAKVFQRLADMVDRNVQADADGYRGGRIQNVVKSGNVQAKFAEITLRDSSPETDCGGTEPALSD